MVSVRRSPRCGISWAYVVLNISPRAASGRHFLRQGKGVLSKRARTNEFSALSEVEVQKVEKLYADSWEERGEV